MNKLTAFRESLTLFLGDNVNFIPEEDNSTTIETPSFYFYFNKIYTGLHHSLNSMHTLVTSI